MNNYSILYLIEDINHNIRRLLEKYFEYTYIANNKNKSIEIYKKHKPDLVILGFISTSDSFEVAKMIREYDDKTILLMINDNFEKSILLDAIKLNFLDYLPTLEHITKIEDSIKKAVQKISKQTESINEKIVITTNCYWNKRTRLLFYKNRIIDLTNNEVLLFELFLEKRNELITPADISSYIWENPSKINDANIRNLVKRLRQKIPVDIIKSIYGNGYILNF